MVSFLPLGSSLVAGVFAVFVLNRWWGKKRIHHLAWGIGLILFSVASLCEFLSEVNGWNVGMYKLYYAFAPTNVAVLGLGTVYLLRDTRIGNGMSLYVLALFAVFVIMISLASVNSTEFVAGVTVGGKAMPDNVRVFSYLFTIPGVLALIGGALYSWWKTRAGYNLLIAAGFLIIAGGGAMARFSGPDLLYPTNLIGIVVVFPGFLNGVAVPSASRLTQAKTEARQ